MCAVVHKGSYISDAGGARMNGASWDLAATGVGQASELCRTAVCIKLPLLWVRVYYSTAAR